MAKDEREAHACACTFTKTKVCEGERERNEYYRLCAYTAIVLFIWPASPSNNRSVTARTPLNLHFQQH